MGTANFDKIILITALLVGSILFQKNQLHYAQGIEAVSLEIKQNKIAALQKAHQFQRNKIYQTNTPSEAALSISDTFLRFNDIISDGNGMLETIATLKVILHNLELFQAEEIDKLASIEAILAFMIENIIVEMDINEPKHEYESEFIVLVEEVIEHQDNIELQFEPFIEYTIPKGQLSAKSNGSFLDIDSAPTAFNLDPENIQFFSAAGKAFLIHNSRYTIVP